MIYRQNTTQRLTNTPYRTYDGYPPDSGELTRYDHYTPYRVLDLVATLGIQEEHWHKEKQERDAQGSCWR